MADEITRAIKGWADKWDKPSERITAKEEIKGYAEELEMKKADIINAVNLEVKNRKEKIKAEKQKAKEEQAELIKKQKQEEKEKLQEQKQLEKIKKQEEKLQKDKEKLEEKIKKQKEKEQKEEERKQALIKSKQYEELDPLKDLLNSEKREQELEKLKEREVNWLEGDFWDSWDKIKAHSKKLWQHKQELKQTWKPFLLAHSKDTISGKPQLIEEVQRTITIWRIAINKKKRIVPNPTNPEKTIVEEFNMQSFFSFEENFDKRNDGFQKDCFSLDFWQYRVIDSNGKEYYIWTTKKLPNEHCTFRGMLIQLDDFAELSRNLKVKCISKVFLLKDFEPSVKILSKEELIKYTKDKKLNEQDWFNLLSYHPIGTYNFFTDDFMRLKSAFILSGKLNGIPEHLAVVSGPGLRKSMGIVENTAYKFSENMKILEGGNSRIKALSPSFKEKPASIGHLAQADRIAFIDEFGKMVDFELNKHQITNGNVMGEINFLLDNKERIVGSGNDNTCRVQANCKSVWITNPISNKPSIYQHVGAIDPTTMSRKLWYVFDEEEKNFVLSDKGIVKIPPTPQQDYYTINNNTYQLLSMCWGRVGSREEFLSLFDTCFSFICKIDEKVINELVTKTCELAKEPMKSSVWRPRAPHHIYLLIDGICKHRCLFKDYDATFTPKQEDYDLAERILTRMVKSWDTDLSPKKEGFA